MSEKYIYENARIKSLEPKLLTAQSAQRLLECSSTDTLFRTLSDMGFGAGASVASGDFDALFEAEERRVASLLREFNVGGVLDVFLLQYDILNFKTLLKANADGKKATLATAGLTEVTLLEGYIACDDIEKTPQPYRDILREVRALKKVTPRSIDVIADRANYQYVFEKLKKGEPLLRLYFKRKADFANIGVYLRCKRLSLDAKFFEGSLVPSGDVDLSGKYDLPTDAVAELLKGSVYQRPFETGLAGKIVTFEAQADDCLLKMFKDVKDDMFTVAPIVYFYLSRATEFKIAKLIAAGVKNGVPADTIRERMRELYA